MAMTWVISQKVTKPTPKMPLGQAQGPKSTALTEKGKMLKSKQREKLKKVPKG